MARDPRRGSLTFRRSSRTLVLALYAALLSAVFFPVVFGSRSLLSSPLLPGAFPWGPPGVDAIAERHAMGDRAHVQDAAALAWQAEPWAVAAGAMYRSGEIPLWIPSMGLGAPLAANLVSGVFSPMRLPVFLWPRPIVWNAYFLIRLLFAGFFMYVFLRRLRVSPLAAFAGGAALMLTGHFVLYVNHWDLDTAVLLPAVMVATDALVCRRSAGAVVALGITGALAALGGSAESLGMIAVFAGAYFVFRSATIAPRSSEIAARSSEIVTRSSETLSRARFSTRAPRFAAAMWRYARSLLWSVGLAVAIASPLFVLLAEYLRYGDVPGHHGSGVSGLHASSPASAISLLVPFFLDHLAWRTAVPDEIDPFRVVPYLGVVPVVLAALAPRKGVTIFFGLYAFMSILKAYGAPVVNLLGVLPGIDRVLVYRYNQPIVAFCVAALMAFTLDAVTARAAPVPSSRRIVATVASIAIGIAGFVAYHAGWIATDGGMPSLLRAALAIAIAASASALVWSARRRPRSARWARGALVALLLLELFSYAPKRFPPRVDAFASAGFVAMLRADPGVFRIHALDGVLQPNTSSGFGLQDVRVLENFFPARYLPLVNATLMRPTPDSMTTAAIGTRAGLLRSRRLLNLLNVKYLVALTPLGALDLWDPARHGEPVRVERVEIGAVAKTTIVQRPPSRLGFPLRVPERGGRLRFSVALDPKSSVAPAGRGVRYRLAIRGEDGGEATPFDIALDPARREDRGWHDGLVDVDPYRGTTVTLVLAAEPVGAGAGIEGGWGDVKIESAEIDSTWQQVYDGEVKVYRNTQALPRAFLVHHARVVTSPAEALASVTALGFEPDQLAILEEPWSAQEVASRGLGPRDAQHTESTSPEKIDIMSYGPRRVRLAARVSTPALLVLSDIFYPGWRATVDGRPATILRADYALRAVALTPGDHDVAFEYRPRDFYAAVVVSLATLAAALVVVAIGWRRRHATGMKER